MENEQLYHCKQGGSMVQQLRRQWLEIIRTDIWNFKLNLTPLITYYLPSDKN